MRRGVFAPPYRWLPAGLFAFFVVCFALHPYSPLHTHHLSDPDDYMRLDEVIAWLQGQSWYDLSVPRMSPGADTMVHWSRLIDLPIAAIALPFIPLMGVTNAVLAASLIVPLIWFALLLALLPRLARSLIGKERARLACVPLFFMPLLLFQYTPGRVDHHGAQAIIAAFGLMSLNRIILQDRANLFAFFAALFFACGFWIGAEALPWAILFIACLGFAAAWLGGAVARTASRFGLFLPLCTAALLPLALPVAQFSSRALSWFSPAYLIFAALAGAALILGGLLSRFSTHKIVRLFFYLLLIIAAVLAFFILVPSSLNGPFADYDRFDATTALDNIGEAQPLMLGLHINRFMPVTWIASALVFARLLFLPAMALLGCLLALRRAEGAVRQVWLTHAFFILAASALTIFWQMRVGIFMEIFSIAPLTALMCRWWDHLRWRLWDRPLFWAEVGVFFLLGPLPVIILPCLQHDTPLYPNLLLFPAARGPEPCALEPVLPTLNDPRIFGAQPLTLMNSSDTGPQLLFGTNDNVVAGNFDVAGNQDAFAFFHATDDKMAREEARKWKADLVLICRTVPMLYLGKDYYAPQHAALIPGKDGLLHLQNTDKKQPLIARLAQGEAPAWLKPVVVPEQTDYLLFRIQH